MVNLLLAYEDGISIGEALNVSVTGFVVVMLILALLAVLVLLLSKAIRAVEGGTKKAKKAEAVPTQAESVSDVSASVSGTPLPMNTSAGSLDTYNVDEKTAAVIMAIISHESGIPLNRLQFKSIKRIEK